MENSASPILTGTLADCWLHLDRQAGENLVKKRGYLELFLKSKEWPGFKEAEQSWEKAVLERTRQLAFPRLKTLHDNSMDSAREVFFATVRWNPSEALKRNHTLVMLEATAGNVDFFTRIAKEIRNTKRRHIPTGLAFHILQNWLHGFLWLATDHAASTFLQKVTRKTVTESSYARTRARLGLVGYEVALKKAPITGCTKDATFLPADWWTKLEPRLSR